MRECLAACNIDKKGFHFHSLRHTHVAYLLSENVNIYAIAKRLGHSDVTTTTRVYSYLVDEYKTRTDNFIEQPLNRFTARKGTAYELDI